MEDYEKKIISKLLKMASEKFSNHGCNDTPEELLNIMTNDQKGDLNKKMAEWDDPESENLSGYDWLLMSYFSDKILEDKE